MKMYEVGGCVRDEILGVPSKDIDYAVVLDELDLRMRRPARIDVPYTPLSPFKIMSEHLKIMGFEVFLETPEYLTVRARFPKGQVKSGVTADFVLARKESEYSDGRRPDEVVPGTLEDDLARRDFTMNAIAKDASEQYIDPFNGVEDIEARTIRAVGNPYDRLREDALRAVRALRFSVTKGFVIDLDLGDAMEDSTVLDSIVNQISDERIREELSKMFRLNTKESLEALYMFPLLSDAIFSGKISLDATMKTKHRSVN